jgi:hypothetical protein
LQLLEILKALESFKSGSGRRVEVEKECELILNEVSEIMLDWNLGTIQICPPVCADILKLCHVIWRLDEKKPMKSSFQMIEKFCLTMWKYYSEMMASSDNTLRAPMVPILLRRLVRLKYMIALTHGQKSKEIQPVVNFIRECLTHRALVDVQQAVLKVFLNTFATSYLEFSQDDLETINTTFVHAICTQRDQNIVSLAMKSLNAIYIKCTDFRESRGSPDLRGKDSFKAVITNSLKSLDPDIASESLKLASNLFRNDNPIFSFSEVLDAIYVQSLPDKIDDMRMSSAKSLAILNMFLPSKVHHDGKEAICQFENISKSTLVIPVSQYLQIWTICFRLLEDEDTDIRSMLAKYICMAIPDFFTDNSEFIVQPRPECLQERIFIKLESLLAPCLAEYAAHLVMWTCNIAKCTQRMMESLILGPETQLFESEKDNQYEDPLVLINLSAHHLSRLLLKTPIIDSCTAWLEESMRCIVNFSQELSLLDESSTDHIIENAYGSLYSVIALAWAVSHGIPAGHIKGPEQEHLYQLWTKFRAIFVSESQQKPFISSVFGERGILEAGMQAVSRINLCFSNGQQAAFDFSKSTEFPIYPRVHFR